MQALTLKVMGLGDRLDLEFISITRGCVLPAQIELVESNRHDTERGLIGNNWADLLKGKSQGDDVFFVVDAENNATHARILRVIHPDL